jgi:hypothetical protein
VLSSYLQAMCHTYLENARFSERRTVELLVDIITNTYDCQVKRIQLLESRVR